MKLSIIIVNYNGKQFLTECIESIRRFAPQPYELIIVDNASIDGSADFIAQNFFDVKLICSKLNLGFTGGNNLGAKSASGDLLLLLNNDTVLKTDLEPMVKAFTDPQLGVLGCHLFYANGLNQPSVGYEHTPWRIMLSWLGISRISWLPNVFRRIETSPAFYALPHDQVAWVSGACFLTPRTLWQSVGGLDERYFMYVEDVDYCKRIQEQGYRVGYIPSVEVVHYEGGGKNWIGAAALKRTMRSYLIYLAKTNGKFTASCVALGLSLILFLRCISYSAFTLIRRDRLSADKLKGYLSAAWYLAKNSLFIRNV